ncbi:MAG: hypothetical protein U0263_06980 [Polyangiaceae bacterium]
MPPRTLGTCHLRKVVHPSGLPVEDRGSAHREAEVDLAAGVRV